MFTVATRCGVGATTVIPPSLGQLGQHANAPTNGLQLVAHFESTNQRCPIITTTLVVGDAEFELNVRSTAGTTQPSAGVVGPGFDQYVTTEFAVGLKDTWLTVVGEYDYTV